jgi:16S rRNA (guanine1516-N2)-methyltransferase
MLKNMKLPMNTSVSSTIKATTFLQKAEELAIKLQLPFCISPAESTTEYILCYTINGLELVCYDLKKKRCQTLLYVDFIHGKNGYRRLNDASIKQPLAKAAGIKPGIRPMVLDATAGLGGDSFVLASLGCQVTLFERNPVIAALLQDGLDRALIHRQTRPIIEERITFIHESSFSLSTGQEKEFDTVYLDPMYPHDSGSALNKQSMRVIRTIVGDDSDSEQLLELAKVKARKRIVVKRPRQAPTLTTENVSYQIKMKSSRYDIYLII